MEEVPIWDKYALTIEETASYFNIGEARIRNFISNNPRADCILRHGNRVLIKRKKFETLLDSIDAI